MITTAQRESLRQFFGPYFHEDWDIVFGTPDQALSAALRSHEDASEREKLSRSIVTFVLEHPDDQKLTEALFKELACSYYPLGDGISTRAWLLSVAAKLGLPSDP